VIAGPEEEGWSSDEANAVAAQFDIAIKAGGASTREGLESLLTRVLCSPGTLNEEATNDRGSG
jgi:hypothetical protein